MLLVGRKFLRLVIFVMTGSDYTYKWVFFQFASLCKWFKFLCTKISEIRTYHNDNCI